MSYCRWSSDNWRCDLYCYEDVSGGITTHVAEKRIVGEVPKVPSILDVSTWEFNRAHRAQMAWLDTARHRKIGLPYDGKTFNDPDYESFLERLYHLRQVGYNFPDYVIDTVKEDIKFARKPKWQQWMISRWYHWWGKIRWRWYKMRHGSQRRNHDPSKDN